MALYLGNNKVSMKSGYTTTGFKDFLEHGGKFSRSNYTDLEGILKYEDTENVNDMSYLFSYCTNLTTIPILNTSNATNMLNMFDKCSRLITIPLLDTSKVTNMPDMFSRCNNLTTIPLLNTSNVTNMMNMFYGCTSLTTIPRLDVSKVNVMINIFDNCYNLAEIHMIGMKVDFDISASTKFTREALIEILNNIATVTSTKTLSMGSTNLAKLTDEDKAIATNKGWTLA